MAPSSNNQTVPSFPFLLLPASSTFASTTLAPTEDEAQMEPEETLVDRSEIQKSINMPVERGHVPIEAEASSSSLGSERAQISSQGSSTGVNTENGQQLSMIVHPSRQITSDLPSRMSLMADFREALCRERAVERRVLFQLGSCLRDIGVQQLNMMRGLDLRARWNESAAPVILRLLSRRSPAPTANALSTNREKLEASEAGRFSEKRHLRDNMIGQEYYKGTWYRRSPPRQTSEHSRQRGRNVSTRVVSVPTLPPMDHEEVETLLRGFPGTLGRQYGIKFPDPEDPEDGDLPKLQLSKKLFGPQGMLGRGNAQDAPPHDHKQRKSTPLQKMEKFANKLASIRPSLRGIKGEKITKEPSLPRSSICSHSSEERFPKTSMQPEAQAYLLLRAEYLLTIVANTFLLEQLDAGRMNPETVQKITTDWRKHNRPTPKEFMFDFQTQYELTSANVDRFVFHGPHSHNPLIKTTLMNCWRSLGREFRHRTFCLPDHLIKKIIIDGFRLLEMLGADSETFLEFRQMQYTLTDAVQKAMEAEEGKEQSQIEHGVTKRVPSPLLVSSRGIIDDDDEYYDDGIYKGERAGGCLTAEALHEHNLQQQSLHELAPHETSHYEASVYGESLHEPMLANQYQSPLHEASEREHEQFLRDMIYGGRDPYDEETLDETFDSVHPTGFPFHGGRH